ITLRVVADTTMLASADTACFTVSVPQRTDTLEGDRMATAPGRRRGTTNTAAPADTAPPRDQTRRLTIDIPADLHFAMKMRATATGTTMVDEVTPLLLAHYANDLKRYQR